MGGVILVTLYIIGLLLFIIFNKWAWAIVSILCGDKGSLENLCDKHQKEEYKRKWQR